MTSIRRYGAKIGWMVDIKSLFFFVIWLSGQTDPIIVIEIAKSAYWVKVNGSRPNNHITIAKKLKIDDFRPKVASRNLSKKGVIFSRGFWRWDSPLLLGQWFQVIKAHWVGLIWVWMELFDTQFFSITIFQIYQASEVFFWIKKCKLVLCDWKKLIESVCFEYGTTS